MQEPKIGAVLITGASSGLGAALARHYAAPGRVLHLWGRHRERLAAVAAECEAAGAVVHGRALDLAETAGLIAALQAADAAAPIGLAIFAAGLGDIRAAGAPTEAPESVLALALVNFAAPATLAAAAAQLMAARGTGQLVLIGSVAAFHALPFAAGYSASKAGLVQFAAALRLGLAPLGIGVTLISPGFIDTPMSRRLVGAKPLMLSAPRAAARIARAAAQNRAHLITPFPFLLLRNLDAALPMRVKKYILRRLAVSQLPQF